MSNSNTAERDNRELTLYLGTYGFDFEQAAELSEVALTAEKPGDQTNGTLNSEEQPLDYMI